MKEITWTRDEAGSRVWVGKRAIYRVVSKSGPYVVELHPASGVEADGSRSSALDAPLLSLDEAKFFIETCESLGDPEAALDLTVMIRNSRRAK